MMLVTFSSDAYENITLFGHVALQLIKMMGQSGAIPSAILAEDIPQALEQLQQALYREQQKPQQPIKPLDDEVDEDTVSISQRALPLIQLLTAASEKKCDVMWAAY